MDLGDLVNDLSSALAARALLQIAEARRADLVAALEAATADEEREETEAEQLRGLTLEAASAFFRGTLTADRARESDEAAAAAARADSLRRELDALDAECRSLRDTHPDPLAAARAMERRLAELGVERPEWVEAERAQRVRLQAAATQLGTFARALRTAQHDADDIPADITGFDDRERMLARERATEQLHGVIDHLQGLAEQVEGIHAALRAAGRPLPAVNLTGAQRDFVPGGFDQAGVYLFGLALHGANAAEEALVGVEEELGASAAREFTHQETLLAEARSRLT